MKTSQKYPFIFRFLSIHPLTKQIVTPLQQVKSSTSRKCLHTFDCLVSNISWWVLFIISHNCPLFCFLPLGHNHWISGPSKPRKVDGPHDEKVEHWDDIWARPPSQNVMKSLRVCKFGSRRPPLPSWAGLGLSSFSLCSTGASGTWSSRPWSFQSTARKERSSGYLEIEKNKGDFIFGSLGWVLRNLTKSDQELSALNKPQNCPFPRQPK